MIKKPIFQEVVAQGFELETARLSSPECYFRELPAELRTKRDRMCEALQEVGMKPVMPQGGYFMMCDYSKIGKITKEDCYINTD